MCVVIEIRDANTVPVRADVGPLVSVQFKRDRLSAEGDVWCFFRQDLRVRGHRRRDGHAAAQRAARQGDEADRHPPGGPELRPPAGPAQGVHEPHAGQSQQLGPLEALWAGVSHQTLL